MAADRADLSVKLMLRVKEGEKDAFSLLYDEHHRRILNFFYRLGADSQLAKDLRQETFLRIWKLRDRYRATGSFIAYILTIARYVWLEHCRGRLKIHPFGKVALEGDARARGAATQGQDSRWAAPASSALEQFPASPAARPDYAFARTELEGQIFSALDKLPEDQRMVFVLQVVEGLSSKETASIMQCPVNTVRSRKILAIRKLRVHLRHMGVSQSEGISNS